MTMAKGGSGASVEEVSGAGRGTGLAVDEVRGVLEEVVGATATTPGYVVVSIPGSSYRLHLRPIGEALGRLVPARVGQRVRGRISCDARRVDVVGTGGRYVEPVIGRPRRVQGTVLAVDLAHNALVVNAGGSAGVDGVALPMRCRLTDQRQRAEQFSEGQLVSMDVLDGATIE